MAREWLLNAAILILSTVLFCLVAEGAARLLIEPRTSGAGMGVLHKHFRMAHGQDTGLVPPEDVKDGDTTGRPRILFLGDSFTTGHGVPNAEAFPSRVASGIGDRWLVRNLGKNADNSIQQLDRLEMALADAGGPVRYVVHQYLGNDIDYLVNLEIIRPGDWVSATLIGLSERSFLVDYIYQPFFMRSLGDGPIKTLLDAYADPNLMHRHLGDLSALWETSHAAGAAVILVLFPMPMNRKMLDASVTRYVRPIKSFFLTVCRDGDALIDVSLPMTDATRARSLEHWVVSQVDAHPSSALHAVVARDILAFLQSEPGNATPCGSGAAADPVLPGPAGGRSG